MDVYDIESNSINYNDCGFLTNVQNQLRALDPLVGYKEILRLREILIDVSYNKAFIIQIGDCAERFSEATQDVTNLKYKQFVFLKSLAESVLKKPVVLIGRIAGQYAKPRSCKMETINGEKIYAYHGDMINSEHDKSHRDPDPFRMLQAYHASQYILACLSRYKEKVFTSHECFLLEYEKPLTRSREDSQYNLSAHTLWLGMRNFSSQQHISYLAKINNPIAIKVGPNVSVSSLIDLLQEVNPQNLIGKITLVTRLGINNVNDKLPILADVIIKSKKNVIWMCDPLHGNTNCDQYHLKFRKLQDILNETYETFRILRKHNLYLGGLHLEASYKTDIIECIDSFEQLTPNRVYESAVDPRLNHNQCIHYFNEIMEKIRN